MRWIQQVNTPVVVLTTVEQVEQFMNKEIKDLEKKVIQTVKVLGLFYDKDEMEEDITQFKLAANNMRSVGEVEFAICTVTQEVKKL